MIKKKLATKEHKEHKRAFERKYFSCLKIFPFPDAYKHQGKAVKTNCHLLFQDIVSASFSLRSLRSFVAILFFSLRFCGYNFFENALVKGTDIKKAPTLLLVLF